MIEQLVSLSEIITPGARRKGTLLALFGAFLMSFDPVFIRISGLGGADTAFLFGLFTALSMATFLQFRTEGGLKAALKTSGWPVALSGALMLGSASGLVFSVKITSVANTVVILSSAPVLAAFFSWALLGETTRPKTWLAIGSVILGITIVVSGSFGNGAILGDFLAMFAALCLSLNQTILRKYKNVNRFASVGTGGFFLAIVMYFFATPATYEVSSWIIMGAMGLLTAPIGRVLSQTATRYITAPEVGMLVMINTVLAPLWAYAFFSEFPATNSVIGAAIILTTILVYTASTMMHSSSTKQPGADQDRSTDAANNLRSESMPSSRSADA